MDTQTIIDFLTGGGFGITDMIAILSIVAAITPTPIDNVILGMLKSAVNVGAVNVGNAKPEKKPKTPFSTGDIK